MRTKKIEIAIDILNQLLNEQITLLGQLPNTPNNDMAKALASGQVQAYEKALAILKDLR